MKGIDAYPLQWPEGWERTPHWKRRTSRYQVRTARARDDLVEAARKIARSPADVVVSTNVELKKNGEPYANFREPADSGVAVYWFDRQRQQRVIACDAWRTVRENMRAVTMAIEAFRQLERCKASEILKRAYQGFAALPGKKSWREVFGYRDTAVISRAMLDERYRFLALERHPDRGGSHEAMLELNQAYEEGKKEC